MKRYGIEYYKEKAVDRMGTYYYVTVYYGTKYKTWCYLSKK